MKAKTVISAPTKEDLEKCINRYFYSDNYYISEDNRLCNKVKDAPTSYIIVEKKGRWYFKRVEDQA